MFKNSSCRFSKFLWMLIFSVLLFGCWYLHPACAEAQESQNSKARSLQEQRLETLRNLVKITTERYKNGQASSHELSSATNARNEAELDLCTSDKQRIDLFEKFVKDARMFEEEASRLVASQVLPETSLLQAKADRLQQEIKLEQAKTK